MRLRRVVKRSGAGMGSGAKGATLAIHGGVAGDEAQSGGNRHREKPHGDWRPGAGREPHGDGQTACLALRMVGFGNVADAKTRATAGRNAAAA